MSEKPKRIQRKRSKGWRMPEGAVYVGRPTRFENVFGAGHSRMTEADRSAAVALYRKWLREGLATHGFLPSFVAALRNLRGKDLACWCSLDQPCHADVLIELANRDSDGT